MLPSLSPRHDAQSEHCCGENDDESRRCNGAVHNWPPCSSSTPIGADRGPKRSCEELSPRNGGSEMKAGGVYDRRFVAPNPSTTNPDWAEIEAEGDAGRSEALGVAGAAMRV